MCLLLRVCVHLCACTPARVCTFVQVCGHLCECVYTVCAHVQVYACIHADVYMQACVGEHGAVRANLTGQLPS